MALLHPFFSDAHFSKSLHFSHPILPLPTPRRTNFSTKKTTPLSRIRPRLGKRNGSKCYAVAEVRDGVAVEDGGSDGDRSVLVGPSSDRADVAEYDWTEEWYPLYLTQNVPDDAPLGLTVFDKQLVLYRDGQGVFRCYQDRCPHRLAKLSEGQLIDGRLECLYHGWQFEGEGKCVKIPQLPANAKIPQSACLKTYEVRDSQGVVWVWMSQKTPPNPSKLPWFENFARPGFQDISTTHELPYDHSILLENLMDPAHVPISHDRTDWSAKREDAKALLFEVTERTDRGFAGWWGKETDQSLLNFLRFEAPCVLQNNREIVGKNGEKDYFSGLFLCRPSGQGKSMLIVRFSSKIWVFFSSQNEVLLKEKVPTKELYLNLKSSDTWVAEYRKWMDKVGHGMPYHFGHNTISLPKEPAVVEHAPAGLVASISASLPAKGGIGTMHAPNLSNRYFRHVIHCNECKGVVKAFQAWKNALSVVALVSTAFAILVSGRQWKALLLVSTTLCLAGIYACSSAIGLNTTNFIRIHRRL
ncbi:translocon at the inner envelope membrane of chloroplasts 55-II [Actinidia rufa]|uniref:Translocon at the inner envelope membrane of chloroplasts 55-II n=1 Tax=Actinidia rufa TaxID=165716 RepID=A0A7J0GBS3_9ERIC|nr:translocon at the inner envelope membrane of chloroplasts 55-II [Actinidia rufa]